MHFLIFIPVDIWELTGFPRARSSRIGTAQRQRIGKRSRSQALAFRPPGFGAPALSRYARGKRRAAIG